MVEKIVSHIIDCQTASGRIKQDENSVYQYGYTLFFERVINIAIVIMICLITNRWLEIWGFLVAIIPLRSYAGGWHANKFWQCAIISNLIVIIMLLTIDKISIDSEIVYVGFEVIVLIAILFIVPIQNSNKPLTPEEKKIYRKKTIYIWIIEWCLMLIFVIYKQYTYSLIILYAHSIVTIAVIAGKIGEKRMKKQKATY